MRSMKIRSLGADSKTFFRAMKLTVVLLIITFMHAHASGNAQSVTCSVESLSLKQVFSIVKQQTGYFVFSQKNALQGARPVSVKAKDMPLADFLELVLKDQPVSFMIKEKTIVLIRKQQESVTPMQMESGYAPAPPIKGRIVDAGGKPLQGAVIMIKGSKTGTAADNAGNFTIEAAPGQILVVSYTGYQQQEIKLTGTDELTIHLALADTPLDEVQIIAYGTTTRRLNTGSVSKVTAAEIARQPVSNPILALQGRMSGVMITESSGVAGSNYNIVIQGQNSINAGKLPLYVIDGVPFGSTPIDKTGSSYLANDNYVNGDGFSPLNSISPNDIESVEILKDADATAIYGSRAANGVVLITTKKGKAGKTKLDLDIYSGISRVTRTLPMLDSAQFLSIRRQAFANDGITPDDLNAPDLTLFNTGGDFDFQKEVMGKTGRFTNVTAAVSGGNEHTRFMISGNFRRETPVFDGNFSDQKMQVRFSLQHRSANDRFGLTAAASYGYDNNKLPTFFVGSIYNLPPNLPLYKGGDTLAFYTGYNNPVAPLRNIYSNKTNNLLSNFSLSYRLLPGLSFKTDLGYNRIETNSVSATLRASRNPATAMAGTGSSTLGNNYNELFLVEPQLNYNTNIGKGKVQALAGGTWQHSRFVQPYFIDGTFTNDALYNDIASLIINSKQSGRTETKYASLFGRLNYSLDDKYVLNATFRRDGSSRFSPAQRYGNFGSVGAAWIFSKENWATASMPWLSFGKLRASYGTIGNDQIGDYRYLQRYYSFFLPYGGTPTYMPSSPPVDEYNWEITRKLAAAMELGFLDDRLLFSAMWFRNRTDNMLIGDIPVASQTGMSGYTGNLNGAIVQNAGWELELNATPVKTKSFTWRTSVNFTAPVNKLVSYPGLLSSPYATGVSYQGYVEGQSLNLLAGYRLNGFENGIAKVHDLDKNGVISEGLYANDKGDWDVLGKADPVYYGGFNNSFSYKNLQLDFLIQFVKKDAFNVYRGSPNFPGGLSNFPKDILNYPVQYTTLANNEAAAAFNQYFAYSDATVTDASFIRLKNISLTYNLPAAWAKKAGLQAGSIYLRAQNLFTITSFMGTDPEATTPLISPFPGMITVYNGLAMPPFRMITAGLQVSL